MRERREGERKREKSDKVVFTVHDLQAKDLHRLAMKGLRYCGYTLCELSRGGDIYGNDGLIHS